MSVILDTNVISELMRPEPDDGPMAWLNSQLLETLFLTSITVAEIRIGIAVLPEGRRRLQLHEKFEREFLPVFADRVLSFDLAASMGLAECVARSRQAGRSLGHFDAMIAAIASVHGFTVATRDVAPFEMVGVPVINPWEVGG